MCDSSTAGHWKFQGGGGVQRQKFPRCVGVHGKLLFQRVKKHEKFESNAQLIPSTRLHLRKLFCQSKLSKYVDRNAKFCDFDL